MGHCRLCHGKFSSRSLRSISGRAPGERSDRPLPGERVFSRDFQRLLGVAVHQDPALPQFVCKNCHAQFYQCHGLLRSFLQRVNVSPTGHRKPCTRWALPPSSTWGVFRGCSGVRECLVWGGAGQEWLSVRSPAAPGREGSARTCRQPGPAPGHAHPLQGWCPVPDRGGGQSLSG